MDQDTKTVLSRNDHLKAMAESEGWKIAKQTLIDKIQGLSNLLTYDEKDPQKLFLEICANQQAIKVLVEFLQEIEGKIAQVKDHKKVLDEMSRESYLKYLDSP